MKLVMIGAGYVGLTTGACLCELGHEIVCVDIDETRLELLQRGQMPIYEPGLDRIVDRNVKSGRLSFASDPKRAVVGAEAVFLAVGTPTLPSGEIDLSHVEAAVRDIAPVLAANTVVILKSTVIAGTARRVREIIAEERRGLDFSVASNPEFLREGSAVDDFLDPDRVVIGTDDPRACSVLEKIYAPLAEKGVPILCTSTINAELIKYAANAMLAVRIGFINDVADLCERVAGDIGMVARGIGLDRRIGPRFLEAGPGFGGSCFPKDTRAFASLGRRHGAPQGLVETVIERNEARKLALGRRILEMLGQRPRGKRVALLGLAFKAGTDDLRDATSLAILPTLLDAGVEVRGYDPKAGAAAGALAPGLVVCRSAYEAAARADLCVGMTDWPELRGLDLSRLARTMRGRTLLDLRNMYSPDAVLAAGLGYAGIGRPAQGVPTPGPALAERTSRLVITGSG